MGRTASRTAFEVGTGTPWTFPEVCVLCLQPATAHLPLQADARVEGGGMWAIETTTFKTTSLPRVPYCREHRVAADAPRAAADRDWQVIAMVAAPVGLLTLVAGLMGEADSVGDRLMAGLFAGLVAMLVVGAIGMGVASLVRRATHSRAWMRDYRSARKAGEEPGKYHPGVEAWLVVEQGGGQPGVSAIGLQFDSVEYAGRFADHNHVTPVG